VRLATVGHGTRSLDDLAGVVRDGGVVLLVDVRRYPASRRQPHLAREVLARELPARGVSYEWWGEQLGGRRRGAARSRHPVWRVAAFRAYADHMDTVGFRVAFDALVERARAVPLAVMCSETVWWRCHRRLLADAAVLAGLEVVHLGLGEPRAHELHPGVRADADGRPVYDVGVTPELGSA